MGKSSLPVSVENLPENPPRPSHKGSWVPVELRAAKSEVCEGCGIPKPLADFSKFMAKDLDLDPDSACPMLCNYCAVYGAPLKDPLAPLTVNQRQGMFMLAAGGTVSDAARKMDISKEKLRDQLTGRERSVFREAFLRSLVDQGLGPDSIGPVLLRAITGKKMQYNSAEGAFEEFEDYAAQTRAVDILGEHPHQRRRRKDRGDRRV